MGLIKNEIPILEYDTNPISVIMPNHEQLGIKLPKRCVYAFLGEQVDDFAQVNNAKVVCEFDSATKQYPIYTVNYKGEEICLVQAPVGSAPSAQILDWLISHGVENIISTGSCGVLVDIPENYFLIPASALRDEGASYHYLPPSRYVGINREALNAIESTLGEHNLDYKEVMTWTTDGFFRETRELVDYRIEEGCSVVEMECSALSAVAQFRGAIFGQILFTADSLANVEKYDPRGFGIDSYNFALKLCFESVCKIYWSNNTRVI